MNKFLCLLGGLLCIAICNAQTNELYNNLDFSDCSSDFFWDDIQLGEFPPTDTDYVYLTNEQSAKFFINAHLADIDTTDEEIPAYSLISAIHELKKSSLAITPISILEMKYDKIKETAVGNGMLFVAGDELFQLPNVDVFEETTALIMHLDIKDYDNNALHFMLSEDTYFQNYGSLPPNGAGLPGAGLTQCSQCLLLNWLATKL